jgi:ArsR family transcriptional regulator
MPQALDTELRFLRAASEPTRLRMLAVIARGEFSVTDLTQIFGQSQPRVSRHLRLLCECGLLLRFRERHWIYYRVPVDGPAAEFVQSVLARLDAADPRLAFDRERASSIAARRAAAGSGRRPTPDRVDTGDLASVLEDELRDTAYDSILYVGPAPAPLLGVLGRRVRRAVGVSRLPAEVQRARAVLHGQGMSHCHLQQGDQETVLQVPDRYDVVVLERERDGPPSRTLPGDGARLLNAGGRLIVVEDYDALAMQAPRTNPLALLRSRVEAAGLHCDKLRPLDVDGVHLLLALLATGRRHDAAA